MSLGGHRTAVVTAPVPPRTGSSICSDKSSASSLRFFLSLGFVSEGLTGAGELVPVQQQGGGAAAGVSSRAVGADVGAAAVLQFAFVDVCVHKVNRLRPFPLTLSLLFVKAA